MISTSQKSSRREKPLLFVIPAVLMLLAGFWLMLSCALGGRLNSASSLPLPVGFTIAAVGGLVLTRTLLGTFFLFAFSITAIILTARERGLTDPLLIPFIVLLGLCLPMARHARR
ncbi:MAG: hypothetical protein ABI600_06500 [Luteolibacter sp.]